MTYEKSLPKLKELRQLASGIKTFPITGLGIVQYAEHLGYDDNTVNFLKLFSSRLIFNNRTELIYHCSLLERLIREETKMPVEHLKSPQDEEG